MCCVEKVCKGSGTRIQKVVSDVLSYDGGVVSLWIIDAYCFTHRLWRLHTS